MEVKSDFDHYFYEKLQEIFFDKLYKYIYEKHYNN